MASIVILGAGIGGLSVSMKLREKVSSNDNVIVVSDTSSVTFNPGNIGIAMNFYKPEEVRVDLGSLLSVQNIKLVHYAAVKLLPNEKKVKLEDGSTINYDILVVATGPKSKYQEISGFGPDAYTHSICSADESGKTGAAWEEFCQNPGEMIVGGAQGAAIMFAAYEYVMIADADLRKRGIRDQVSIKFVTPEPFLGYRVQDGSDKIRTLLEKEFVAHDISWVVNAQVDKVEQDRLYVSEIDENGEIKEKQELTFKHCMLMPAFSGVDALQNVDGLVTEEGFVIVDEFQRSPVFPDIYAIGACVEIPQSEQTPVPVAPSKPGTMTEIMSQVAAANIQMQLNGKEPAEKAFLKVSSNSDSDKSQHYENQWINTLGGTFAPNLWQQLSNVENK